MPAVRLSWEGRLTKDLIMKSGVKAALALAAGYYLGRHRKLRLAVALAAAGAAGRLRKGEGGLLNRGVEMLGSPELEELAGRFGQELRQAGRTAAVAATGKRIDALSDRIHERVEKLRAGDRQGGSGDGTEQAEPAADATGSGSGGSR
ncbi:hypothetical protein SAMN04489764_0833 [Thermostaphylospora chromogena]|uniref:Uncharacterized protein n=2 Tax=Thermostaphylospora chromogena TaxID=35622 RepID=A0A1H1B8V4_9ACTN|nr:hypothetical protein SAMN04489764_0833 [Thermostaphylospora chromogena]